LVEHNGSLVILADGRECRSDRAEQFHADVPLAGRGGASLGKVFYGQAIDKLGVSKTTLGHGNVHIEPTVCLALICRSIILS